MSITLADQYYLKAFDAYPYNLEETVENLNYALSYDEQHTSSNYLMGRLYMEKFLNYEIAEGYFIEAISSDPYHLKTCESYTQLLIRVKRFVEAKRLIQFSFGIKGVNLSKMYILEARVYEHERNYVKAKELLKLAMAEAFNQNLFNFLGDELKRLEQKQLLASGCDYNYIIK